MDLNTAPLVGIIRKYKNIVPHIDFFVDEVVSNI